MARIWAFAMGLRNCWSGWRQVEDLLWVRFLYAYPNRVTQKLLDTLAAHPRLAKYMDMPLQHASRNVLARMKRGSHGDAFLKLARAHPRDDSRRFAADFVHCRFSRRNGKGLRGTLRFCARSESRLDGRVRIFGCGQREQLRARCESRCGNDYRSTQPSDGDSEENLAREIARAGRAARPRALVEGPSKDNPLVWEARLEGMAPDIDGKLYLTDIELPGGETAETGDVARVEIIKADTYDLIGPRRRDSAPAAAHRWRNQRCVVCDPCSPGREAPPNCHWRSAARPRLSYTHSPATLFCGFCGLCVLWVKSFLRRDRRNHVVHRDGKIPAS